MCGFWLGVLYGIPTLCMTNAAAQIQERQTVVDDVTSLLPLTEEERVCGVYIDVMMRGQLPKSRRPVIMYAVMDGQVPR